MRVVLDSNVVISAILFRGRPRSLIASALRGEIDLVTCPALLAELEELLEREFGFPAEVARAARAELESLAIVVVPAEVPRIVRDPDDDEVLAAAVEGRTQGIVTGHRDLLSLEVHQGITMVDTAGFEELARGPEEE